MPSLGIERERIHFGLAAAGIQTALVVGLFHMGEFTVGVRHYPGIRINSPLTTVVDFDFLADSATNIDTVHTAQIQNEDNEVGILMRVESSGTEFCHLFVQLLQDGFIGSVRVHGICPFSDFLLEVGNLLSGAAI